MSAKLKKVVIGTNAHRSQSVLPDLRDTTFGEQEIMVPAGDGDWSPVFADLAMPADDPALDPKDSQGHARAVRLFARHSPPRRGIALAMYDDFALISWQPQALALSAPMSAHSSEFLRVAGEPGSHALTLTFSRAAPPIP